MKKTIMLIIFILILSAISFANPEEDLECVIFYYKDNEESFDFKIKKVKKDNPVIDKVENLMPEGYILDQQRSTSLPYTVTKENKTIKIYYKSKVYNYSVIYYKDGENLNVTDSLTIKQSNPRVDSVTDKSPEGYSINQNLSTKFPVNITQNGQKIHIYYSSNSFPYIVKYYMDGKEFGESYKGEVKKSSPTVNEVPDRSKESYKKSDKSTKLPFIVTQFNNVIHIYYEKNTLEYEIKYYKDDDLIEIDANNNISSDTPIITRVANKAPEGYVFDKEKSTKFPFTVTKENKTIEIYYKPEEIEYKIKYYKDNEDMREDEKKKVSKDKANIKEVPNKAPKGYIVDKEKSTRLPYLVNKDKNLIKIYYVKGEYEYIIRYFKNGEDMKKDEKHKIKPGDKVTEIKNKIPEGYVIDENASTKLPLLIDKDNKVINIYYVRDPELDTKKDSKTGVILVISLFITVITAILIVTFLIYRKNKVKDK